MSLGRKLDVTFQQVQKYENGANRISASKLFMIATALGVEPGYFFEGLDVSRPINGVQKSHLRAARVASYFERITDPQIQNRLYELIKSMTAEGLKKQKLANGSNSL